MSEPFVAKITLRQPNVASWEIPYSRENYPLVNVYSLLLKMAIEIVDFPINNGDFP